MSASESDNETTVLSLLVAAVPKKYRLELSRLARRIRERLPPAVVEHRIDALERLVDSRLREIEAKVEEILRRLEKR